jgi:hypothetical protein
LLCTHFIPYFFFLLAAVKLYGWDGHKDCCVWWFWLILLVMPAALFLCVVCAICSGGGNALNGGAPANIRREGEGVELGGGPKGEISYQNVGGSSVDDERDRKKTCDEILEDGDATMDNADSGMDNADSTMDNSFGNKRSSDGEEGLPDEEF